ncbi:hypothetical protein H4219_005913 [Mycoemilia scoparia]|uniref:t-SNARE coiled-coil homology domain-containing protein n=1 Tax=Mycoemilia scoparia TaxID=417184 RepID=A0A9W7ZTZ8_9FUNG|nr:hypothetical protein H4219_005913 [Mycoemilia scoparia]
MSRDRFLELTNMRRKSNELRGTQNPNQIPFPGDGGDSYEDTNYNTRGQQYQQQPYQQDINYYQQQQQQYQEQQQYGQPQHMNTTKTMEIPEPLVETGMDEFQQQAEMIEQRINDIQERVEVVSHLHAKSLGAGGGGASRSLDLEQHKQIEIDNINILIREVGKELKQIGKENDILISDETIASRDPGLIAIRRGRHGALLKRYYDEVGNYRDIERKYQQEYRQQMEYQIRMVKPEATEQEIQEALDDDNARSVFAQSIMGKADNKEAQRILREVEDRNQDIKQIERNVLEINQLFSEMHDMVQRQQAMVDDIEQAVESTKDYTKQGVEEVQQGIIYRKKSRKKIWIILGILGLIVGIVIVIILFVVVKVQNR